MFTKERRKKEKRARTNERKGKRERKRWEDVEKSK